MSLAIKSILFLIVVMGLSLGEAYSQTVITGNVTAPDGSKAVGVSVYFKGTTNGTTTDINGKYSITPTAENATLVFTFIGYKTIEKEVQGLSIIDVMMEEASTTLDEFVVMGYGTQKKKLVTGATVQVKGEDLQKMSSVSTLSALQGQTPGLSIIATSGRPDAAVKINIRGLGTIGYAEPLIVINGIAGGDLKTLSPSDIESIDVLKDAASAAIYGSRAANGVILVTTKQGKAGKSSVAFDMNYGVQNVENYLDMVNADEYMTLINESSKNSGAAPIDFEQALPAEIWSKLQEGWTGTNWWKELSNKNAPVQNYSLSATGGTDMSTYSIGMSFTDQEAILGNPLKERLQRYSIRINSDHVLWKMSNRNIVKFGENLLYTFKKNQNRMNWAWRWDAASPLMPVYDSTGAYTQNLNYDTQTNPVGFQNYNSQNENKHHDVRFNMFLEIQPIKNLVFKSNFGYSMIALSAREYSPVFSLGTVAGSFRDVDQIDQGQAINIGYQFENTLTYKYTIKGSHNLSALVGQSIEETGLGESISGSNSGSIFNSYEYAYLSNVKTITPGSTLLSGYPIGQWAISSFFGRINYDYKETYLFTALLRRDGSSNFAEGYRWGNFPSVSAGWIISNENFLQSSKGWLDYLKLRASWGQNGNQAIPPFQYLSPFTFSGANYYFGTDKSTPTIGAYPKILSNEGITWETSEQLNLGIDSRFFKGRLQFTLDVYDKKTKDWLVQAPILGSQGAGAPYINGGEVNNKGVELVLGWNDNMGDFTYGISGNFAYNENKITRIANTEGLIEGTKVNEYATGQLSPFRAEVGYPIGYFWGFQTAGVFQNQAEIDAYTGAKANKKTLPGDLIFVDLNEDGVINSKDRTMIGDPNPRAVFGFSVNLGYKGFDFSATATGVSGNKIMNSHHLANSYKENYPAYMLERWHGEGTSNRYPRLTSTPNPNYTYFSDIYLENGDYLRIQNITLGYDFKKQFKAMPGNQARLYVAVQNLFTFTNYNGANPEVGSGPNPGINAPSPGWSKGIDVEFNPIPRTFMVGANLKF